ncbi:MAG: lytic transglycosylase domain-containing protein [Bacteroidota bacterium]
MNFKLPIFFGLSAAVAVLLILAFQGGTSTEETASPPGNYRLVNEDGLAQIVELPKLKASYDFAGEPLPMDNFDVRERLERELVVNSYYHSGTSLNLRKAVRYFPVIEKILAEKGLPEDLKYLAVAESNLSNVTSPAGAKGFWQFMKPSAGQFGLQVNSEVDERFHLEKSTEAACTYFLQLKKRFGTWTNAAAAYNVGPTRFSREKGLQKMDSYYDLNLNEETGRYLFRIVAIKEVLSNPKSFGFFFGAEEGFPPLDDYKIVEVKKSIPSIGDFAKEHGTTYRMIKVYNPWLISHKLTIVLGRLIKLRCRTDSRSFKLIVKVLNFEHRVVDRIFEPQ